MDTIIELTKRLDEHYENCGKGYPQNFFQICSDCKEAANKLLELLHQLDELQSVIDDMLGDHYTDLLIFYSNRCEELWEQLEPLYEKNHKLRLQQAAAIKDIKELVIKSGDACEYCKHNQLCNKKKCEHYIEGTKAHNENGKEVDFDWSCMDFNYGDCPMLENTPCNGCIQNNDKNFEWRGI